MKGWKDKFMSGRNGLDECGKGGFRKCRSSICSPDDFPNVLLELLFFVAVGYGLFRVFSKNREKRLKENHVFMSYVELVKMNFEQRKTHRIFMCKVCGKKSKSTQRKRENRNNLSFMWKQNDASYIRKRRQLEREENGICAADKGLQLVFQNILLGKWKGIYTCCYFRRPVKK